LSVPLVNLLEPCVLKSVWHALSRLLFTLPALAVGVLLASSGNPPDVADSTYRLLPLTVMGMGSALCLLYGRVRPLLLLWLVYASLLLLQGPVAHYQRFLALAPGTEVVFHSVSLWLPALFALMALWPEQGRLRRDIGLRVLALAVLLVPFALLAGQDADGMQRLLSDTHWPGLATGLSPLAQLPAWVFVLALALLGWQVRQQPRPTALAAVIGLAVLYLMLPRIFITPLLLVSISIAVMVLMISAVVQESFDLAFRDDLTGLPGRRALNDTLKGLGTNYTLAMVDVDHFKKFNDTHGHDAGDQVLKLVASRLAGVGGGGRAFRYGGEEFTLVFAGGDARSAREAIEQVRVAVADARMQLRNRSQRDGDDHRGQQRRGQGGSGSTVNVTVSIGVADHRAAPSPQAVIKAADKALYAAKAGGRNCVRVHGLRSVSDIVAGKPAASAH